jgi:hypothetical protein
MSIDLIDAPKRREFLFVIAPVSTERVVIEQVRTGQDRPARRFPEPREEQARPWLRGECE